MSYTHNIVFSYDQVDVADYIGNFRIDLLKCLLKLKGINSNSFDWWVETTFTFQIINDDRNNIPLPSVIQSLKDEKLYDKLNFHIGLLRNYSSGNAIKYAMPSSKGQQGFLDDITQAKKEINDQKKKDG